MVAAGELAAIAAQSAPTTGSAAAWRALFPARVGPLPEVAETSAKRSRAEVRVRSDAGDARVMMLRERGAWKVDLIGSINIAPQQ
jgi:hypothetical protein